MAAAQSGQEDSLRHGRGRDPLTGLLRGADLEALLLRLLRQGRGTRATPAVLYFGLDRFRHLNELLGYEAGDIALRAVAERLKSFLERESSPAHGRAARMGGDEFAILWPECEDDRLAYTAAERLLERLRAPFEIHGRNIFLTASAGVAVATRLPGGIVTLLRRAAAAMSKAKERGGNVAEIGRREDPLNPEHRYELESALRTALERGELRLRFQPLVDRFCKLDGLEVLLAWNHPRLGLVEPEIFIRLAEEIGAILPIGDWVLEQACLQLNAWREAGLDPPRLAVNVSAIQFAAPDFVEHVQAILSRTGTDGSDLEFEITESTVLHDIHESAERMRRLKSLGISLAIDDFGVGYSPLIYIQQLPLDSVKVDRTFIRQITKPSGSLPLVHTITVLAHHRGLKVVAEGVETLGEMELVRAARCDRMQGFLFGPPASARETEALLRGSEALFPFCGQAAAHHGVA